MPLKYILICLLAFEFISFGFSGKDTITDQHLFDFDKPVFDENADKTRKEWEAEFIEFGKKVESTPKNYVKHVLSWFNLDGKESRILLDYKDMYLWQSGLYSYRFFLDPSTEIYATKESLREAYLFSHISRENDNISRLWTLFGDLVMESISPYLTAGRKERLYVQGLLDAWVCISEKKQYEKKLKNIYNQIALEQPDCDQLYEYVTPLMCDDLNERFDRRSGYYRYRDVQWIYTFWVRRYHEGNVEITLAILQSML